MKSTETRDYLESLAIRNAIHRTNRRRANILAFLYLATLAYIAAIIWYGISTL